MKNIKIAATALLFCTMMALSVNNKVIVIDAGHGGWDPGKISDEGHEEAPVNLAIAGFLQQYLEISGGAIVFTTRGDCVALGDTKRADLRARANMPTDLHADIFISIHQNSFPKSSVKGAQVFYYETSAQSKRLAEAIQVRITSFLDPENGKAAKGVSNIFLLEETATPAVVMECGFFTNPDELKKLLTEEYQQKIAWAIYLGILDYFE
ncbi:MAG: N-acetylmuramoyl-L-alanine amidase [Defluviitaleaceae bacterium]|nr:N-acetylmuramoyl-L-alanine amidase [Defluviitaleaceae bacterium]